MTKSIRSYPKEQWGSGILRRFLDKTAGGHGFLAALDALKYLNFQTAVNLLGVLRGK